MATTTTTNTTTTEIDLMEVQKDINNNDNGSNKMMLNSSLSHYDYNEQDEEDAETESITLTNNNDTSSSDSEEDEEGEIINLHHSDTEEELSDYQLMLKSAREGYKRMELKGESESDKDLIIYSLNESLQIHKEIVGRIQNEKDDLEDVYKSEKKQEKAIIEEEKQQIEEKTQKGEQQLNKLESVYQSLLKELENKKLEYKRMETIFYSQIKGIKKEEEEEQEVDDLSTITIQIRQLISGISELTSSLASDIIMQGDILDVWWPNKEYNALLPLDTHKILLLTEKKIMETLLQDIFYTSIHPGVSLNQPFQQIHHWVDKRNSSWASRMKQQITCFIVKQSNEEQKDILAAKQAIIANILFSLSQIFLVEEVEDKKNQVEVLVEKAVRLDLAMKCCQEEIPIDILPIKEKSDRFDENFMITESGVDRVLVVISPPFVASSSIVIVPAKVYCS
jgi:hypothetical protein